jgi:pSer/pThr/pTyr-binding forkhead associated (FHA) protein
MPTLIYKIQEQSHRFPLTDRVRIGRVEDNDLCVPCDSMSSHHALIARNGDGFQITDAGSRNGILVDGQKVNSFDLADGTVFALGDVEFVFSAKDEAVETAPAAAAPKDKVLPDVASLKNAHDKILAEIGKVIVGQREVLNQMLVALFARGHCLLIGVPGLAKTLMVKTLGEAVDLESRRIQFTPDLMPSDITGTFLKKTPPPANASSVFIAGRSSRISYSPTKSIARRPRRRPRCSKRCKNIA